MVYDHVFIPSDQVPRACSAIFQHLVDTYASETNKLASVWRAFADEDLHWKPHSKSMFVGEMFKHQLLSERRFFGEMIGFREPAATDVQPRDLTVDSALKRLVELATPSLEQIANTSESEWLQPVNFFGAQRERIWVFWRRVLHTAHHRTQLTVYLRLLGRAVPPIYGPTADVTWSRADPTLSVEAGSR